MMTTPSFRTEAGAAGRVSGIQPSCRSICDTAGFVLSSSGLEPMLLPKADGIEAAGASGLDSGIGLRPFRNDVSGMAG